MLKLLGWRISRVWAMEWWENRDTALQKLLSDIDNAVKGNWDDKEQEPVEEIGTTIVEENSEILDETRARPYNRAELTLFENVTPDEVVSGSRAYLILRLFDSIIQAEAPISKGLLLKRTIAVLGISRIGPRLSAYFDALLKSRPYLFTEADGMVFYWNKEQVPNLYNIFRPDSDRDALDIAPEEVSVAVCEVLDQQGALPEEDLLRQVAKCFTFSRMGDNVILSMRRGLELSLQKNRAVKEEGKIKLKK